MNDIDGTIVPVWTLSTTQGSTVPAFAEEGTLTPERLSELRSALAAFASAPLVTLEAHPLPAKRDRSTGLPLDAMSPSHRNSLDSSPPTRKRSRLSPRLRGPARCSTAWLFPRRLHRRSARVS